MTIDTHQRSSLVALADRVPDLSPDARCALFCAVCHGSVTDIFHTRQDDWYISGRVAGRDFWLTPAEWQRDHARLLKEAA
jgi:hypothetical protein